MKASFADFNNLNVFLTGHTGFKGSWMSLWLARLGAHVTGYALAPETNPSLYGIADIQGSLKAQHMADIRDQSRLADAMLSARAELVVHLAAQPLVRRSYRDPVLTWSTNVMGVVHLLESVRACPSVKAVLIITTDKCYENKEWYWGYREVDSLGGYDPYSASKAGTELVVQSYRKSFFNNCGPLIASARAGNVIGGGDWSEDRLIPDAARAVVQGEKFVIRSPGAIRPWQHVLEPIRGYLLLAEKLLEGDVEFADAFNFGPDASDNLTVAEVLTRFQYYWPELKWVTNVDKEPSLLHETHSLYLDSSKARQMLNWSPVWNLDVALEMTARWYRNVYMDLNHAREITDQQLDIYSNGG